MNHPMILKSKWIWLLSLLTGGLVLAATVFDPDWINTSTNGIQPVGYVGSPIASGYVLTTSKNVYSIDYSSADWSGDVHSQTIDTTGTLHNSDNWTNGAAQQFDNQDYNTGRFIVTNNAGGVPFRWGSLSATQKTALDNGTTTGASTSPVLDYIRGQRTNESPNGANYRTRASVLGDIIHSTPLYWDDGTAQTVFVGANDGMLHAINAGPLPDGGKERFAFVPSQLIPKLPLLKASPYTHRYFVDGQLAARRYPAYTQSNNTAQTARSILVGGLGGGGRGLFGLDIGAVPTSESDAASKVLWEISNATSGFTNLGHTYGTPLLTILPNGDAALLIGNGYNNTGNGHATLLIINPHSGALIAEIDTGSGSTGSPNGLSSVTVADENFDGRAEYAYAGDIDGNLWKFDLTASPRTAVKLFTTNPAQAITSAPSYKVHPLGGRMVNFATGKIFDTTDAANTSTHYAYGIWDRPSAYAANDTLLAQTLTETSYTGVNPAIRVRTASNNLPVWTAGAGNHMGWKTALPVGGERLVGDGAFVTGSVFLLMTRNPAIDTTATPPGANWWMQLNALTGGTNTSVLFDLNSDGGFDTQDQVSGVIPVGRFMGGGVRSQLIGFSTTGVDLYLSNYDKNGDPPSTTSTTTSQGVAGGHFDQDIFYGSAQSGNAGLASGSIRFTYADSDRERNVTQLMISVSGEVLYSGAPGSKKPKELDDFLAGLNTSTNYKMVKDYNGSNTTLQIIALFSGAAYNGPISVNMTVTNGNSPYFTKVDLTGGVDMSGTGGDTCVGAACRTKKHFHQYDDVFDVTGVNFLKPSSTTMDIKNAIPSLTQNFKVIVSNQYLSPAVNLHIGDPSYQFNVDAGYIPLKGYTTGSTLDLNDLQTYRRDPATVWTTPAVNATEQEKLAAKARPKFIGSFAINMPVDALTPKDWWGNGDVRVGLHPTYYACAIYADGDNDGNMYKPVIPPANEVNVHVNGPGTNGWSSSTTPATATGVRHNGALTVQVISDRTPNNALELNVPGQPEYGWRVKSSLYGTYVLAEYVTFWHHPNNICYGATGWSKNPGADNGSSRLTTKEKGSTDPKIGEFGLVAVGSTTTTITNSNGSTSTKTVTVTSNGDGTYTITTTITDASGGSTTSSSQSNSIATGGVVQDDGTLGNRVTTPQVPMGRVNWRELRR